MCRSIPLIQVVRAIDVTENGALDALSYLLDLRMDPAGLNILRTRCIFSQLVYRQSPEVRCQPCCPARWGNPRL